MISVRVHLWLCVWYMWTTERLLMRIRSIAILCICILQTLFSRQKISITLAFETIEYDCVFHLCVGRCLHVCTMGTQLETAPIDVTVTHTRVWHIMHRCISYTHSQTGTKKLFLVYKRSMSFSENTYERKKNSHIATTPWNFRKRWLDKCAKNWILYNPQRREKLCFLYIFQIRTAAVFCVHLFFLIIFYAWLRKYWRRHRVRENGKDKYIQSEIERRWKSAILRDESNLKWLRYGKERNLCIVCVCYI